MAANSYIGKAIGDEGDESGARRKKIWCLVMNLLFNLFVKSSYNFFFFFYGQDDYVFLVQISVKREEGHK